jgi:hypothetical protein
MALADDQMRLRECYAANDLGILKHVAPNLVRQGPGVCQGSCRMVSCRFFEGLVIFLGIEPNGCLLQPPIATGLNSLGFKHNFIRLPWDGPL